jgi:hypothetical protein
MQLLLNYMDSSFLKIGVLFVQFTIWGQDQGFGLMLLASLVCFCVHEYSDVLRLALRLPSMACFARSSTVLARVYHSLHSDPYGLSRKFFLRMCRL